MAHDDEFYEQLSFEDLIPEAGNALGQRAVGTGSPDMEFTDGDEDDGEYGSDRNPTARPATLTLIPTSTTDPERPRTLAAGYDRQTGTLTVVFRDGTLWNYYEVTPLLWQNFASAISKGAFIYSFLDPMGNYGPASGDDARAQAVVDYARARQMSRSGVQTGQAEGYFPQAPGSRRRIAAVKHVERRKAGLPTKHKNLAEVMGYSHGNLGGTGRKRMDRQLDEAVESFFKNRGRTRPPGV